MSQIDLSQLKTTNPIAELDQFSNDLMPRQIQELRSSAERLEQIAAYCRTLYAQPDMPKEQYRLAMDQTKSYTIQALSTVAYQMGQASTCLQEFMSVQMSIAEEQASELHSISSQFNTTQEVLGREAVKDFAAAKTTALPKSRKISEPSYVIPGKGEKKLLDLNEYDTIGTPLINNQNTGMGESLRRRSLAPVNTAAGAATGATTAHASAGRNLRVASSFYGRSKTTVLGGAPEVPALPSVPNLPSVPTLPSVPAVSGAPSPFKKAPSMNSGSSTPMTSPPAMQQSSNETSPVEGEKKLDEGISFPVPPIAPPSMPPPPPAPSMGAPVPPPPPSLPPVGLNLPTPPKPPGAPMPPTIPSPAAGLNLPPPNLPPPNLPLPAMLPPPPANLPAAVAPPNLPPPNLAGVALPPPPMKANLPGPPSFPAPPPMAVAPSLPVPPVAPPPSMTSVPPAPEQMVPPQMHQGQQQAFGMPGFNPQMLAMMAAMGQITPQMMQMMMGMSITQVPPTATAGGVFVRAMYAYQAQAPEELTIMPGEIIRVISDDQGDGWMEGRVDQRNAQGLFPSSYVSRT